MMAYELNVPEQKGWDMQTFDNLVDNVCQATETNLSNTDHPLGYHEHYTNDLKVAKKSAIEWASDYGRASVEDRNLETVFAVR